MAARRIVKRGRPWPDCSRRPGIVSPLPYCRKSFLAVRSGLAAYGRNNVTYVTGLGSFHRLSAFYSDMPCDGDEWHELRLLDRCVKCRLCHRLCPTGAIARDRFLLHAERCIVFHNEKPWTVPFPAWLDPAWHNCLVGCLLCQAKCPENRDRCRDLSDGCGFTAGDGARPRRDSLDRLPALAGEEAGSARSGGRCSSLAP